MLMPLWRPLIFPHASLQSPTAARLRMWLCWLLAAAVAVVVILGSYPHSMRSIFGSAAMLWLAAKFSCQRASACQHHRVHCATFGICLRPCTPLPREHLFSLLKMFFTHFSSSSSFFCFLAAFCYPLLQLHSFPAHAGCRVCIYVYSLRHSADSNSLSYCHYPVTLTTPHPSAHPPRHIGAML